MLRRRALVDVDGILWDFHNPLRIFLRDHFGAPDKLPTYWDWYQDVGVTDKQFSEGIRIVHAHQVFMPGACPPFDGAKDLLARLHQLGYETVIASHRRHMGADMLAKWLLEWELVPFAGVYAGSDKHFAIDPGGVVIDDAPMTIRAAIEARCGQVLTLTYPWNAFDRVGSRDYLRCPNLTELARRIL